ncbi:MAG: hypothetical protein JW967_01615 [Dehalococcoidales bacterium]|nr:hypothetical protein [Dehalococcoidales bacterium]
MRKVSWLQIKCPHCGTYINMVTISGRTGGQCKKCGTGLSLIETKDTGEIND